MKVAIVTFRKSLSMTLLMVLILTGCGSTDKASPTRSPGANQTDQAIPNVPASTQTTVASTTQTPVTDPDGKSGETSGTVSAGQSGEAKADCKVPQIGELVPVPNVVFELPYPKGWSLFYNARWKDSVQVGGPCQAGAMVNTYRLGDRKSPTTVDEFLQLHPDYNLQVHPHYLTVSVREIQVPKSVHTFEVETTQGVDGQTIVDVAHFHYGKNYEQVVDAEAPKPVYEQLRPTFAQMLQSFRPSNLDADVLPAHP